MKNLCHVVYDEYPKDSRVRRYSNALREEGYRVFIVCSKGNSPRYFEQQRDLNIYRIPISKHRRGFFSRLLEYILFFIASASVVTWLWARYRISWFQVHTLPDFLVFACIVPKIFGANIILDFHELFPEFLLQRRPNLAGKWPHRLLLLQEALSFWFADRVIIFSDPAKRILQARAWISKEIHVIMNGVDESEFPVLELANSPLNIIVYNGTINNNLNLSLVVGALERLKTQYPVLYQRIEFRLYGDGPDLANILEKAKVQNVECVQYMGRLPFGEMMQALSCARMCILPPKRDIYADLYYSLKLVEMIYLKIPVVATRLKTYLEYYPEDCLFYFDSEDIDGLVEKIVLVSENPALVAEHTKNAFKRYQAYRWDIMRKRFLNLLAQG